MAHREDDAEVCEEEHQEYVQKGRHMDDEEYHRRLKPSLNMIIATMFLSCASRLTDSLRPAQHMFLSAVPPPKSCLATLTSTWKARMEGTKKMMADMVSGSSRRQVDGVHNHHPQLVALLQPF